ncbi:helix-turn-helix domain-containing protein [Nocardia brasiliensis]
MVFDSTRFDLQPYAGFDFDSCVRRTYCSFEDAGWQSLLVQRFEHAPSVNHMPLPAAADLHLVLPLTGKAVMQTRNGGRSVRSTWLPGAIDAKLPGQATSVSYRGDGPMRSVQVHIPRNTVDAAAAQLGEQDVDFEAVSAALTQGDPLIEEVVRALAVPSGADDLYAESAAAFLSMHLLVRHAGAAAPTAPAREDRRVRAAVAMMRERFAEPITLADIAGEVHLSVYHLVRVFRTETGTTPHQFLLRLRVDAVKRLLRDTELSIEQIAPRCGFGSAGALSTAFLRYTGVRPSVYRKN